MKERLFDVDKHSGIIETFTQHEGKNVIRKHQNIDAIVNANQAEMNSQSNGWAGDMHKVASIPLVVIEQWREEMKQKGFHNCDPLHNENKTFLINRIY